MKATTPKWAKLAAIPAVLALSVAVLAGCTPASSGAVEQDADAPLLIWADATRLPAFEAYKAANPDLDITIETIDPTALLSKIQLANRVGEGWPDVIFDPTPSDVAALSSPLFDFALPLDDLVDKDIQANFATENSYCTIDGTLYCMQNDLAQDVLWYNKPLLEEFGYEVPTTWEEYGELGERLSVEHPGYLIGGAGASTLFYDYLWSSGCPLQTVLSSTEVQINVEDEKCTRVADLLDPLLENGSVSRLSPFDASFMEAARAGKLLMSPAASWLGEYVFKGEGGYNFAPGTLAAAPMPIWPDAETNYSGAQGGGIYVVSSHSKNIEGAVAAAVFAATDIGYQSTAPTYPAYIPAAEAWLEKVSADPFYAEDPSAVLVDQASKINPAQGPTRYPIEGPFNATVVAAVTSGQTIASGFPGLQAQLAALAASAGYEVKP